MKIYSKTTYIVIGIIGLIVLSICFLVVNDDSQSTKEGPTTPEESNPQVPSIRPSQYSLPLSKTPNPDTSELLDEDVKFDEAVKFTEELDRAIAALEQLDREAQDQLNDKPPRTDQPSGIIAHLKAFRESSEEYKELDRQFESLTQQHTQLRNQASEAAQRWVAVNEELHRIPVLTEKQKQDILRTLEQRKDELPPGGMQEVLQLLRNADERQEERKQLERSYQELFDKGKQLDKEIRLVSEQIGSVNRDIISLHHRHGLPGTHEEVREALQKEQEQ